MFYRRLTSRPTGSDPSGRGTDSSRRIRTRRRQITCDFDRSHSLFTSDRWKMVEKPFEAVSAGKVIDQVFHRHTSPRKHWRAAQDIGITPDDGFEGRHGAHGHAASGLGGFVGTKMATVSSGVVGIGGASGKSSAHE